MRNPSGKQPQTLATKKTKWQRSIEEFGCDLFAGSRNPGPYPAGQGQNQRGFQRRRRDHCQQKKTRLVSFQHKKIVTHEKQRMPFYTPLVTRFQPTRQHADSKKPYVSNGAWQRLIAEVLIRNPKKNKLWRSCIN